MALSEKIYLSYSAKVRANLILSYCVSDCVYLWVCVRAQSSSGGRKCEQGNPLLAGLQHHMEVSQPLVFLEARYHVASARCGRAVCLL